VSAAEVVDAAIAEAVALHPRYRDPAKSLEFALGFIGMTRAWASRGWPEVLAAARAGDAVAVEMLCRRVELLGAS
jgi:hypothetical protein